MHPPRHPRTLPPVSEPAATCARLNAACAARKELLQAAPHDRALRLFNGFTEGDPRLVVDLYGTTLLVHNHANPPPEGEPVARAAVDTLRKRLPWLRAGLLKTRHSADAAERRGRRLFGGAPDRSVREDGVHYALDLQLHRDASLYLDTRTLRQWLLAHAQGRSVLNTFAYTGSLGVAARAGGAREVVQLDRNRRFLDLARASCVLNRWARDEMEFLVGDFFPQISRLRRAGRRFDCVILDPPFFATTPKGTVDLVRDSTRLINKVRPLINHGGHLVAINNALFVSGAAYLATLRQLCADGYLTIADLIPVPEDVTGYPATRADAPITDPAPFNHATKIAVLAVRRKDAPDA